MSTTSAPRTIARRRQDPGGHTTSANYRRESALYILPERCVKLRRRQVKNSVVSLVDSRDNERVHEATNTRAFPPAFNTVEGCVPERVIQTLICESAAAAQLRETRHIPRGDQTSDFLVRRGTLV